MRAAAGVARRSGLLVVGAPLILPGRALLGHVRLHLRETLPVRMHLAVPLRQIEMLRVLNNETRNEKVKSS